MPFACVHFVFILDKRNKELFFPFFIEFPQTYMYTLAQLSIAAVFV